MNIRDSAIFQQHPRSGGKQAHQVERSVKALFNKLFNDGMTFERFCQLEPKRIAKYGRTAMIRYAIMHSDVDKETGEEIVTDMISLYVILSEFRLTTTRDYTWAFHEAGTRK